MIGWSFIQSVRIYSGWYRALKNRDRLLQTAVYIREIFGFYPGESTLEPSLLTWLVTSPVHCFLCQYKKFILLVTFFVKTPHNLFIILRRYSLNLYFFLSDRMWWNRTGPRSPGRKAPLCWRAGLRPLPASGPAPRPDQPHPDLRGAFKTNL